MKDAIAVRPLPVIHRSQNERAAPAGPRSGPNVKMRLANATMDANYRAVAISATTPATVRVETEALIRQVRAEHGPAAFEMPKRDAAVHEAGHAVVYAVQGASVRTIRVFPRRYDGVLCWGGKVLCDGGNWRVDAFSNPLDDLQQAQLTLAGLAAEAILHAGRPRPGSSLDELTLARALCRIAGRKLGRDPVAVYDEQVNELATTLGDHWPALIALADELERTHLIHRRRAQELLAPVREWEALR